MEAVLLIDALAVLLVVASGFAGFLWLDRSHPSPLAGAGAATPSGPSFPSVSPDLSATASESTGPTPTHVLGDGTWTRADPMARGTWAAASARLRDGRVLVAGGSTGQTSYEAVSAAAVFDPATGHWTAVTHMLQPRVFAMAVTLADGSVLVAGGSRNGQPLDTAERYHPGAGTWVAAGRLNLPRADGTLTLLPDGRVLAAGGGIEGGPAYASTASAEVFDPATGVWSITAPMSVARACHTATRLSGGEVLVVGGATTYEGEYGSVTATAELFNPRTNTWRAAGSMSWPRYVHAAALLQDGRVLVAGGWYATPNSDPSHNTAEIYDPAANGWAVVGSMKDPRAGHILAMLPDGRVLVAGGVDAAFRALASGELFDPATAAWTRTGSLQVAVVRPAAQALPDGRVLVAGGGPDALGATVTAASQVYWPPPR